MPQDPDPTTFVELEPNAYSKGSEAFQSNPYAIDYYREVREKAADAPPGYEQGFKVVSHPARPAPYQGSD